MSLRAFLNTRFGVEAAMAIAQGTPRRLGYQIARLGANFLARRRLTDLVKAVHVNQWVVGGCTASAQELHETTIEVFRNTGYSFYDFYHNLDRPEVVKKLVCFDESFERNVRPLIGTGKGVMVVAPHLSNFDLAGRYLALTGFKFQVLSYPITPGGYKLQNKLRSEGGLEVTPMTVESMRTAKQRLLEGGMVLTGMDRPMEESNYPVRFFGHLANLPVAYIRMAMQTAATVILVACRRNGSAGYNIIASEAMEMLTGGDLKTMIIANAERVAAKAEAFIRSAPRQWAMFYPVWPQLMANVPRLGARQQLPSTVKETQ